MEKDNWERLLGTTQTLASNIAYAPFGPVKSMDFSNGKTETRGVDLQYRPGSISVPGAVSLSYTYGLSGNISSVTDGLAVSGSFAPAIPDNEYSYAAGSDKLAGLTGGQSVSLTYDANGNITAKGNLTFEYFQDNRLSTVRQDGSIIASYDYNSLGQRTRKTVGDLTTLFHYDLNGNLICETGPDGTILKEYVYLGNLPLAMVVYGTEVSICYYHTNHLGTPVLITDAAGQAVWKADYYPFGKVDVTIASVENNLRFPGQYYDAETGLHYNWHRYYDPETGRYLTPDPIGLAGGINPFVYVSNNPINLIDLLGLTQRDIDVAINLIKETQKDLIFPKNVDTSIKNDKIAGQYMLATDKIKLNENYLMELTDRQAVDLLDTLIHETLHANDSPWKQMMDSFRDHPDIYKEAARRTKEIQERYLKERKQDPCN